MRVNPEFLRQGLFEKTKPISFFVFRMWYIVCRVLKKQSQF